MIKFNKCKLNPEILDQWVNTNVNVLLIGEKGVGKSHQILDTFKRNNLKYAYFSGATLDPWIHLLGIPKAKVMEDGKEKMDFILPENLDDDVEAIFCDEWNRTNKVVRNALLELQQFKSINGRKFPNLKMVWGAVNPPKGENDEGEDYDVDELDPAQLDRFHIVVELPNEPDLKYFKNKFGNYHGKILVDWWNEQPKDALKILSPRRLDYVGDCFKKGLDIKYLLPISANAKELIKKLSLDEREEMINLLLENPNDKDMQEFLSDDSNFLKYKNRLKNSRFWKYWKFAKKEFLTEEIKTNENFENFAIYQVLKKDQIYRDIAVEISKSNPKCNLIKIIKSLVEQNYIPEDISLNQFVTSNPNFSTVKGNAVNADIFSAMFSVWQNASFPKSYKADDSMYFLNTSDRRKAMGSLTSCLNSVKDVHHAINFMMSNLLSMQKGTLSNDKQFLPLFGSICVLAKKHLSNSDLQKMVADIIANKHKISNNRVEDFITYLSNGKPQDSGLPDSFLKKIKDIRSVLNISGSGTDLIDLLKL